MPYVFRKRMALYRADAEKGCCVVYVIYMLYTILQPFPWCLHFLHWFFCSSAPAAYFIFCILQGPTIAASGADMKPKKKMCCACPDTKKLRDECIVEHGEAACSKWIDAHLKCLRAEGFNV
ncbi:hypothetical protein ACSBR2_031587 [Camellia fascicularis]